MRSFLLSCVIFYLFYSDIQAGRIKSEKQLSHLQEFEKYFKTHDCKINDLPALFSQKHGYLNACGQTAESNSNEESHTVKVQEHLCVALMSTVEELCTNGSINGRVMTNPNVLVPTVMHSYMSRSQKMMCANEISHLPLDQAEVLPKAFVVFLRNKESCIRLCEVNKANASLCRVIVIIEMAFQPPNSQLPSKGSSEQNEGSKGDDDNASEKTADSTNRKAEPRPSRQEAVAIESTTKSIISDKGSLRSSMKRPQAGVSETRRSDVGQREDQADAKETPMKHRQAGVNVTRRSDVGKREDQADTKDSEHPMNTQLKKQLSGGRVNEPSEIKPLGGTRSKHVGASRSQERETDSNRPGSQGKLQPKKAASMNEDDALQEERVTTPPVRVRSRSPEHEFIPHGQVNPKSEEKKRRPSVDSGRQQAEDEKPRISGTNSSVVEVKPTKIAGSDGMDKEESPLKRKGAMRGSEKSDTNVPYDKSKPQGLSKKNKLGEDSDDQDRKTDNKNIASEVVQTSQEEGGKKLSSVSKKKKTAGSEVEEHVTYAAPIKRPDPPKEKPAEEDQFGDKKRQPDEQSKKQNDYPKLHINRPHAELDRQGKGDVDKDGMDSPKGRDMNEQKKKLSRHWPPPPKYLDGQKKPGSMGEEEEDKSRFGLPKGRDMNGQSKKQDEEVLKKQVKQPQPLKPHSALDQVPETHIKSQGKKEKMDDNDTYRQRLAGKNPEKFEDSGIDRHVGEKPLDSMSARKPPYRNYGRGRDKKVDNKKIYFIYAAVCFITLIILYMVLKRKRRCFGRFFSSRTRATSGTERSVRSDVAYRPVSSTEDAQSSVKNYVY